MGVNPALFVVGESEPGYGQEEFQLLLHTLTGLETLDFIRYPLIYDSTDITGKDLLTRGDPLSSGPLPTDVNLTFPISPGGGADKKWSRRPYVVPLGQISGLTGPGAVAIVAPYDANSGPSGIGVPRPFITTQLTSSGSLTQPLVVDNNKVQDGARLIVGPCVLGEDLIFGTIDGDGLGRIWRTGPDLRISNGTNPAMVPIGSSTLPFPDAPGGLNSAASGCDSIILTDTHVAMLENNGVGSGRRPIWAWVWELGGGAPSRVPVNGLAGSLSSSQPIQLLPGVWLPGIGVGGWAFGGRWQTYTIGATVEFSPIWFTIDPLRWAVLPDELRVLEGSITAEVRSLADGTILSTSQAIVAPDPAYLTTRIPVGVP